MEKKVKVFIEEADYRTAGDAVERIFSQVAINWKGKTVLLKPNIVGPWSAEKGATTHPVLVTAVITAVEKRGGIVWVGDNPGLSAYGISSESGDITGIRTAAGSRWVEMGKHPVKKPCKSLHFNELVISEQLFKADLIINLPKFKTHALTILSGSIKNMFGILVGGQKVTVHSLCPTPGKFADALTDIYSIRKPDLTIMDAVVGMEGNGPTAGILRNIGKIIASTDGVAVDTVMAVMAGITPLLIPQLKAAKEKQLGETDLLAIEVVGQLTHLKNFKLPVSYKEHSWLAALSNRLLAGGFGSPKLTVNKKLCKRCGVCGKHCPRNAIVLTPYPVFDRAKCIGCYCCFELCEPHAIGIGSLLTRIMRGFGNLN